MFSGLTSYLFGSSATEEAETEQQQPAQEAAESTSKRSPSPKKRTKSPSCGLKTVQDEDEWMLVDKSSSYPGTPVMGRSLGEEEFRLHSTPERHHNPSGDTISHHTYISSLPQLLANLPNTSTSPLSSHSHSMNSSQTSADSETRLNVGELSDDSAALSDMSSIPERVVHPSMDESWLVTPPPCFTLGGNSPLRLVGTGPMENLLIEHTSMSVYGPRGRPSSRGHESDGSEESAAVVEQVGPSKKAKRAVTALPPRRPKAMAVRAGLQAQVQSLKAMQKTKQKKESRHLSRGHLNRENKVQHYSGRQQQQRRKHYMLRPSGACNDRKSQ